MRIYPKSKYSKAQIAWCKNYEHKTTFDPIMCDFEDGEKTFKEAAHWNVKWFEDWSVDALHDCDYEQMSFATD